MAFHRPKTQLEFSTIGSSSLGPVYIDHAPNEDYFIPKFFILFNIKASKRCSYLKVDSNFEES